MLIGDTNRRVYDHWKSLCGERRAPLRETFDPRALTDLLPRLFMLSWNGPEDCVVRLCGTLLTEKIGVDITGYNVLDLYGPEERDDVRALHQFVATEAVGVASVSQFDTAFGRKLTVELLMLPLEDRDGRIGRILGAVCELTALPPAGDPLNNGLMSRRLHSRRVFNPHTGEEIDSTLAVNLTAPPSKGLIARLAGSLRRVPPSPTENA